MSEQREHWGSKIGLILAMAGNAIGLGNFLRFPTQAAQNGGGVFMIPYMFAMLFIAIPLMWIEWALGRYGGSKGKGTMPGILSLIWKNPISGYLGGISLAALFTVLCYYVYIESWTLGYSFLSLFDLLPHPSTTLSQSAYLKPFADSLSSYASPSILAYTFFLITVAINGYILYRGVSSGIEKFAKFAMPLLFLFAFFLMARVMIIQTPNGSAVQGLNFLWKPDFSQIMNAKVWLAAAGQVFFTLSLGFGMIANYASYMDKDEDIVASGLSAASLNELAEVVLGGSIVIPAAVAFFGVANAEHVAKSGAFNIAFVTLPALFSTLHGGNILGFMWFFLLFFAGATSSVAIAMPVVAFLEEEVGLKRHISVISTFLFSFLISQIPIFFPKALDEMDFWAGTFAIVLFAFIEVIVSLWIFDSKKFWDEMNRNAIFKIPKLFYYVMKYVTPTLIFILLLMWSYQDLPKILTSSSKQAWIARLTMVIVLFLIEFLIFICKRRNTCREAHFSS